MTVYCAAIECVNNHNAKCLAKKINLSSHSVMTVWDGRQDFLKCKSYEKSEEAKRFEKWALQYISKRKDNETT